MALQKHTDLIARHVALVGHRGKISGGGATDGSDADNGAALAGTTVPAASVKQYFIPVRGLQTLDVILKPGAHTGTMATGRLLRLCSDNATIKTQVALSGLTDNTVTVQTIALAGDDFVVLELTTLAASTLPLTLAEFAGR